MFILKFIRSRDTNQRVLIVEADDINISYLLGTGKVRVDILRNQSPTIRTNAIYFLSNDEKSESEMEFKTLFVMNENGRTIETVRASNPFPDQTVPKPAS